MDSWDKSQTSVLKSRGIQVYFVFGEKNLLRWEVSCRIRPNINLYSKARKNLETSASWRHKGFGEQDGIRPVEKKLMLGEDSSREKSNIIRSCVD